MRNAGAARRRREPEPEEPDPVAAAVAELGRVVAASDATRRRLERHGQAVAGIIAGMEQILAAGRPDPGLLAAAADELSKRYSLAVIELISDAAHNAEGREILERLEPRLAAIAMMRDAWIAEGRRREAADRDAQAPPARGPRHARKHLRPVPGIGSAAGRAVLAAGVAAATVTTSIAAMHEEAAVRTVASAPAPSRGVDRMPPDTAVLIPSSTARAYVPRHAKPSADAATATPAPSPSLPVLASPSPSVPPASSSPVTSGTVNLQTLRVVVGQSGQARIVFTASGTVQWSASVSGPVSGSVSLSKCGGLLGDGQSAVIVVTVQPGTAAGSAMVTITDQDGNATQVPVTWVALPIS